jgi:hypothetical protein
MSPDQLMMEIDRLNAEQQQLASIAALDISQGANPLINPQQQMQQPMQQPQEQMQPPMQQSFEPPMQ